MDWPLFAQADYKLPLRLDEAFIHPERIDFDLTFVACRFLRRPWPQRFRNCRECYQQPDCKTPPHAYSPPAPRLSETLRVYGARLLSWHADFHIPGRVSYQAGGTVAVRMEPSRPTRIAGTSLSIVGSAWSQPASHHAGRSCALRTGDI